MLSKYQRSLHNAAPTCEGMNKARSNNAEDHQLSNRNICLQPNGYLSCLEYCLLVEGPELTARTETITTSYCSYPTAPHLSSEKLHPIAPFIAYYANMRFAVNACLLSGVVLLHADPESAFS